MASRDGRLLNVDRWTNYVKQNLHLTPFEVHVRPEWPMVTRKQLRRMKKKSRKHHDYSVGKL